MTKRTRETEMFLKNKGLTLNTPNEDNACGCLKPECDECFGTTPKQQLDMQHNGIIVQSREDWNDADLLKAWQDGRIGIRY